MITTSNIIHQYNKDNTITFEDISLQEGSQVLIVGSSGCGKTTILHVLGGLLKPLQGEVFINQQSLYEKKPSEIDSFRGENIGIVFQAPHFVNSFSVEDNLFLTQELAGFKKNKERVVEVLERVKLVHKLKAKVFELSQGEKQRITIARAVINSPKIILADEPTSSLDDSSCQDVIQLLKASAKAENATLIIVTHDQRLKESFNEIIKM
jgi:putative ABC transport system ATP-binding protein